MHRKLRDASRPRIERRAFYLPASHAWIDLERVFRPTLVISAPFREGQIELELSRPHTGETIMCATKLRAPESRRKDDGLPMMEVDTETGRPGEAFRLVYSAGDDPPAWCVLVGNVIP